MTPQTSSTGSPRRTVAIGVVAATLTVGAAGATYALTAADRSTAEVATTPPASPTPVGAVLVPPERVLVDHALVGAEEYTQERADAFWGAGFVMEDANALAELWDVEVLEAKGRAGQLLLDGQPVPVAPGSSLDLTDPEVVQGLQLEAFWDAGYTGDDGAALAALWNVTVPEAKAAAGQMLRDGQPLPLGPRGARVP